MRARRSFLKDGHGNGAGQPRIEHPSVYELSAAVPAEPGSLDKPPAPAVARTSDGRVADPKSASELGRLGAAATNARRRHLRALESLGLRGAPTEALAPYLPDAEAFAASEVERLALAVGGGTCAPAAASMVQSAALQLAGSRCAFASGQLALGSRLADASRQNLLAAFELCAREAVARRRSPTTRQHQAVHDASVAAALARTTADARPPADFQLDDEETSDEDAAE